MRRVAEEMREQKAQKDKLITSAPGYAGLLGQLSAFRSSLTDVATYGHIPVPLVYTQVSSHIRVNIPGIYGLIGQLYTKL